VVDHCFPILEHYGDALDELEDVVVDHPTPRAQHRLHGIRRELTRLRRDLWPLREVIHQLQLDEGGAITPAVKAYLRDVYDHAVQVMDILETHREMAGAVNDLYVSAMSHRMNEIMKVLTIMASFFIPITFVAGVYGMNFEHMPEMKWKFSYAVFWLICLGIAAGLAIFFWRKGWLGRK
jgi:magnesium transporter